MNEHYRHSGVYGLRDPRTGTIRYVGSSLDIWNRYSGHLRPSPGKKGAWIKELKTLGLTPDLVIIEDMPAIRDTLHVIGPRFCKTTWNRYCVLKNAIRNAEETHISAQFLAGGCDLNGWREILRANKRRINTRFLAGECDQSGWWTLTHNTTSGTTMVFSGTTHTTCV